MLDQETIESWKKDRDWPHHCQPTAFHMAVTEALETARTAYQLGDAEPVITGTFFTRVKEVSSRLTKKHGSHFAGPHLEALVFSSQGKSIVTERKLGADFATAFWEPDDSLLVAVFQAKNLEDTRQPVLDISQRHASTQKRQALDLLSTAMRAPGATDNWDTVHWAHYVGWGSKPWERVQSLSRMGSRLAQIAGVPVLPTIVPLYTLPMDTDLPRFFDVLCHGAGQPVEGTRDLTHWLRLTREQVRESSVVAAILKQLKTYFIVDARRNGLHAAMMTKWVDEDRVARRVPLADEDGAALRLHVAPSVPTISDRKTLGDTLTPSAPAQVHDWSPVGVLRRAGLWAPEALVEAHKARNAAAANGRGVTPRRRPSPNGPGM